MLQVTQGTLWGTIGSRNLQTSSSEALPLTVGSSGERRERDWATHARVTGEQEVWGSMKRSTRI